MELTEGERSLLKILTCDSDSTRMKFFAQGRWGEPGLIWISLMEKVKQLEPLENCGTIFMGNGDLSLLCTLQLHLKLRDATSLLCGMQQVEIDSPGWVEGRDDLFNSLGTIINSLGALESI